MKRLKRTASSIGLKIAVPAARRTQKRTSHWKTPSVHSNIEMTCANEEIEDEDFEPKGGNN